MSSKEEGFVFCHSAKSILEIIYEETKDVPQSEWGRLPKDLAENHNHYLYGDPKHYSALNIGRNSA